MTVNAPIKYRTAGIGIWNWLSNGKGGELYVVMACAGEVPTLENLAAADFLRKLVPDPKVHVVNIVNLMKLQSQIELSHGLSEKEFYYLFYVG